MSNASDYCESGQRTFFFRSGTFAKPTVLAIVISSGTPTDDMTGANCREWQNVGGYVRQTLNPSDSNWSADDNTQGLTYNNVAITFPVCTTTCGWASGFLLTDTATYGQGQQYFWASSNSPKFFDVNDQLVIPVSGLSFQFR